MSKCGSATLLMRASSAPPAVCAMQYWQPAARLATCATSRLNARSTSPSSSQIEATRCAMVFTIIGFLSRISMLFGMKPSAFVYAAKASFREVRRVIDRQWFDAPVHVSPLAG